MLRKTTASVLALWLATAGVAAARSAADLYYERSVMLAANERCRLFTPEVASALAASALQARGVALRQGVGSGALAAAAERAREAAFRTACTSADMTTAAGRVRDAFSGYARTTWMNFPGDTAVWRAERRPTPPVRDHQAVAGPLWRMSESGRWTAGAGSPPVLGLADILSRPLVLAPTAAAAAASSAFLIVRDPAKAGAPYLPPASRDPAARLPPRALTRSFVMNAKDPAPASLFDHGRGSGTLFGFPAESVGAMEALDPRESILVEIVFPDRAPLRAVFEVGDFAAARAFLLAR